MHSLLQWNIWYKEPIQNIVSFIRKINPDIACLQEISRGVEEQNFIDTIEYIQKELSDYSLTYKDGQIWPEEKGYSFEIGNLILTKYPIADEMYHYVQDPHEDPKEDYTKQGRVYVEAKVNIRGDIVTIGTVHMSFAPKFVFSVSQKKEADRLMNIIGSKDTKYFLTGDFNATQDSYTIQNILKHLKNAGPELIEKSWTTKPFDYPGFYVDTLDYRLDYIFCTPDIKIIESKILPTKFSDHLPILTTFKI